MDRFKALVAWIADNLPPGAHHALIGLAIMGVSTAFLSLLYLLLPLQSFLLAAGGLCAVWFYAGRERRQAEEKAGSNRIPPWQILPRSWRDIGWPAAAVTVVVLLSLAL